MFWEAYFLSHAWFIHDIQDVSRVELMINFDNLGFEVDSLSLTGGDAIENLHTIDHYPGSAFVIDGEVYAPQL